MLHLTLNFNRITAMKKYLLFIFLLYFTLHSYADNISKSFAGEYMYFKLLRHDDGMDIHQVYKLNIYQKNKKPCELEVDGEQVDEFILCSMSIKKTV